jgi:hypothetical protein
LRDPFSSSLRLDMNTKKCLHKLKCLDMSLHNQTMIKCVCVYIYH